MIDFSLKIAGRTVAVRAIYDTTRLFCRDYLWEEKPDFEVTVTKSDLVLEHEYSAREGDRQGLGVRNHSDAYLEVIALLRKVSEKLVEYDTLLFHGSVVAVDGVGYLFTAPSGTGKSTHTRLWREMLGSRAVMVNDDKPFLRITETGVLACGSPWNGKHRLDTNTSVPLKAICVLERGEENRIRQIPAREALTELFQQSYRPRNTGQMVRYMDLLDRLSRCVTFYRMACNMDPGAARMAYNAMAGQEGRKFMEIPAKQAKGP